MLNGQHPVLGAEPSKGVEERLLSILHQFQQEQVQRQQRPKHQRSSSLFAGSPASDHQRSMSNCMPPFSRSGSLIPPACATPLAVPLKAPSTTSAPDIPTTTASSIAAAPAPATNQPPPNSHAIGQVRLNTNLSRSSGHARSILTGSNDSIPHDSVLAHAPSDSSACMAGSTHCSKLGTMAKDTSILAGAESSLLARLPAHPPRSSSSTALTGKGSGDAFGSADRPPCPSVPSVSPPASGLACNGCAFTVGSGSPGSPHQRTPSLLLQQLHVRTPSLGNMSNSSSVASGLHGLSGKGGPLDSTLSSPRRGASQIADTVPPPPGAAKVEAPSEVDPQPSSQATGHGSWAPWLTANTSTLPMPQPPAPTATLPQQQQQQQGDQVQDGQEDGEQGENGSGEDDLGDEEGEEGQKREVSSHTLHQSRQDADLELMEAMRPHIVSGEPNTERKSTFQAHLAPVRSTDEVFAVVAILMENNKVRNATHNIMAYRIYMPEKSTFNQDCDDDGEACAGGRLLHMMQAADARDVVVVVTRWFGGVLLGPQRFALINNTARMLLEAQGYISKSSGTSAAKQAKSKGPQSKLGPKK
mmetsp:Transcript_8016/g.19690  ORF Transcript_8016/g.19690 Transcript_8016/m.19690 type:complete len:585 (+) Transcript_8016:120-1874(+)